MSSKPYGKDQKTKNQLWIKMRDYYLYHTINYKFYYWLITLRLRQNTDWKKVFPFKKLCKNLFLLTKYHIGKITINGNGLKNKIKWKDWTKWKIYQPIKWNINSAIPSPYWIQAVFDSASKKRRENGSNKL